MAEIAYNIGKTRIAQGLTDLDGGDIRMAIIITSKTGANDPDLGTIAAIDAVGTVAFHTERVAMTSLSVTQDNTNDRANIDSANVTFAAAPGVTALAAVVYDNNSQAGTPPTGDGSRFPITYHDTGFPQPMDGGLVVTVSDWARLT